MAKYLDSKGLGYLWEKIVDNFALKIRTQEKLISGENIKTINGKSIMGSGNLVIGGGPAGTAYWGAIEGNINDQEDLITKFNTKQDTLISGTNIKTINGYTLLGDGNIEITGSFDPSILTSYATKEWVNEQGFINNTVDNLVNYFKKSETYDKTTIDEKIAEVKAFEIVVADELPTAGPTTMGKMYLIPAESEEEHNYKDEYITVKLGFGIYVWEKIGSTKIDLTDYAKKEYVEEVFNKITYITYNELIEVLI